jgi:hypothetical protein
MAGSRSHVIRIRRWGVGLILALSSCLACSSPSGPSGSSSLAVQLLDELTGQPITDAGFGIVVQIAGPGISTQQPVNGTAVFSGIASGTYRVTTDVGYGYRQLDIVTVNVDGTNSLPLKLKPIDDLMVTGIFVDGQGSIPDGGTIDIPFEGVTLRFRGKYRPLKYPWPSEYVFQVYFNSAQDLRSVQSEPTNSSDWQSTQTGWVPCTRDAQRNQRCDTSGDLLNLYFAKYFGSQAQEALMVKTQQWLVHFRLTPGCCRPPLGFM